jgi:hypothetical protein
MLHPPSRSGFCRVIARAVPQVILTQAACRVAEAFP